MRAIRNLVLIGIIGLLASACTLPDYQLRFDVTSVAPTGISPNKYVTVDYSMTNIGQEKLYNARLKIQINTDQGYYEKWTTGTDLRVDYNSTGSVLFSIGTGTYITSSAIIVASGWDTKDKDY